MGKKFIITEEQLRFIIMETSDDRFVAYHCSTVDKEPEEFEKNGVWLSLEEPDDVYGEIIYSYEVDGSSVKIADEGTLMRYILVDEEVKSEMERMGCDEHDIATMPWGFSWFDKMKSDGFGGYSFGYDGFTYIYIFDVNNIRRLSN